MLFAVPCSRVQDIVNSNLCILLQRRKFHRNCIFLLFMASLNNEKETRLSRVAES